MKRQIMGLLFSLAAGAACGGTTYTWTGSGGTDSDGCYCWNTPGNWQGNAVPASGDDNVVVFALGSGTCKYKNDIAGLRLKGFQVDTPLGSKHTFEGNQITLVGGSAAQYADPWSIRSGDGLFYWQIPLKVVGRYYYKTTGGRSYLYNDFAADAADGSEFRISSSGTTNLKGDWSGFNGTRWVERRLDLESADALPSGSTLTLYSGSTAQVRFNAKDAVFAGKIMTESKISAAVTTICADDSGSWTGDFTVQNKWNESQNMTWTVAANKSFTFGGGFLSGRGIQLYVTVASGATATFTGTHTFEASSLRLNGAGTTAIDRSLSGLAGLQVRCYGGGTVKMMENGDLTGNSFQFGYGSSNLTGTLDLNGYDQTVAQLSHDSASTNGFVGFHITSANRATLAVNGASKTSLICAVIEDEAGVCADGITLTAQPQAAAVSSGWFEAKNDGVIDFSSCASVGPLARLSLTSGCTVTVPSGTTIEFAQVYLDGSSLPIGDYDSFVTGGGKVRAKTSGPTTKDRTFTWQGGSASESTAEAANWKEGAPDLTSGRSALDFASGTASAVLADNAFVHSLALGRAGGFRLSAADEAVIGLFNGGMTVSGSDVQEISAPIATAWAPQVWDIGEEATLKLSGPVSTPATGAIIAQGPGTLRLEGANEALSSPLVATGGLKVVVNSESGLGADTGSFTLYSDAENANGCETSYLYAEGDRAFAPAVSLLGATGRLMAEGAALTFKNTFTCLDGVGSRQTSAIRVARNAKLDFEGGIDCGGVYRFFLNVEPGSTTTVSKAAIEGVRTSPSNAEIDLCATESTLPVGVMRLDVAGSAWRIFRVLQGKVICGVANALARDGWVLFGRTDSVFADKAECMVVDLEGHDQLTCGISTNWRFTEGQATYRPERYAIVTSDTPATLTMNPTQIYLGSASVAWDGALYAALKFSGEAALRFAPSDSRYGAFSLAYQVSDTKGALEVSSGTLTFARGAGWGGSTNVTVGGTGTLAIEAASVGSAFGARGGRTVLTLADSGKLSIPAGETVVVRHAMIDGEYVAGGTYGGVGSGAADLSHASHFTENGGILRVRSLPNPGLMILVR